MLAQKYNMGMKASNMAEWKSQKQKSRQWTNMSVHIGERLHVHWTLFPSLNPTRAGTEDVARPVIASLSARSQNFGNSIGPSPEVQRVDATGVGSRAECLLIVVPPNLSLRPSRCGSLTRSYVLMIQICAT